MAGAGRTGAGRCRRRQQTQQATESQLRAILEAYHPAPARLFCRTHYAANLMAATPKASWPWVRALLHSVYDQPDAASVHAQFDRVLDAVVDKVPKVAEHLDAARADALARARISAVPASSTPAEEVAAIPPLSA